MNIIRNFSATEKLVFGILTIIATVSALYLALSVNNYFLEPIPAHGGKMAEGIVGLPRYINPVLAITDIDRDLSTLIYSGLMKYENGKLIPDLAEGYTVSDDGLVYTFTLKDELRFHDGVPLTTDDIEFTIQKIEDVIIKSPRRADWANIAMKKVSPKEIQFVLKQPYAPFLSNTTIGILPKHIWSKVEAEQFIYSQYNTEPIGSGPYALGIINRDKGGIPEYYTLYSFNRYSGGEPYIEKLDIYFYSNEKLASDAYKANIIQAIARISPLEADNIASTTNNIHIVHSPLPRIFGIFFNQNQASIFTNDAIREALNIATPKDKIIKEVLHGYGIRSDSPLPIEESIDIIEVNQEENIEKAKKILADNKVSTSSLEFSIATVDSPDLKQIAEIVKEEWSKIGANVTIKVFEYGDLSQNIIGTRRYDALLFGESIGKDIDLYAFWHSSQRNAPGLNIAMYVNSKADKLLEDARATSDEKVKEEKYAEFEKIIKDENPAIFLYSPEFVYIISNKIKGLELTNIKNPSDRFYNINKWYTETDSVWRFFVK
ncbi:MAG TPA: ABC transporter substrate-binding protein [Candidatus Paceibacterota bacterium]